MFRHKVASKVQSVALLTVLAGCSTYSSPELPPAPDDGRQDYSESDMTRLPPADDGAISAPSPTEAIVVAAYQPLLEQAVAARNRGDYERSLVLLERAQRIDPGNPDIYLVMAQTHSARGDTAQASAIAERGLLYCAAVRQCQALRHYIR